MTYIAKPAIDDSEILNHIARDLVLVKDGETMLKRGMKIATSNGVVHEISFAQLDGLLNILDTTREIETVTPLQYLIQHYALDDMIAIGKEGWLVPEYVIVLMAENKTVRLEGILSRTGSVNKEFSYALGGFDFIQQLSLARVIAGTNEAFKQLIGTFDASYTYRTGPEGSKVTSGVGL